MTKAAAKPVRKAVKKAQKNERGKRGEPDGPECRVAERAHHCGVDQPKQDARDHARHDRQSDFKTAANSMS